MVEIIPKAEVKKTKISKIVFALSFIILMSTVISFFILFYIEGEKREEKDIIDQKLEQQDVQEINRLKARLLNYKRKIDDFKILIDSRKYSKEFFVFLEDNTHVSVNWSDARLLLGEAKLSLKGEGDNLITVIEQILVFQNSPDVHGVELKDINPFQEGKVGFGLEITLNPKIFSK